MRTRSSLAFDTAARCALAGAFLFALGGGSTSVALAEDKPEPAVALRQGTGGRLELDAKAAPLAGILDAVTRSTGVRIRHDVLPEQPVTAHCQGATVKELLGCLLGPHADLVLESTITASGTSRVAAVRILASSFGDSMVAAPADREPEATSGPAPARPLAAPLPREPEQLLAIAENRRDPRRADALGRLIVAEGVDPNRLKESLTTALTDRDGVVRAQAVFGLATLGGADAETALATALHDRNLSVRLMAVDNITADDKGRRLLEEALHDRDSTVRAYAAAKLDPGLAQGTEP